MKLVDEIRGVAIESGLGILAKVLSVGLSLLLITRIAAGDQYYLTLVYGIGLVNMAKIFDGSLPYLQRLNHPLGRRLKYAAELRFSLAVYSFHFVIFYVITSQALLSAALSCFGKLYAISNFRLNIAQRSYFLYLQHALALGACLLSGGWTFIGPIETYLLVSSVVLIVALAIQREDLLKDLKSHGFYDLWDSNISFNLATMTIFFFYAEFAAVFLYGQIPDDDYATINTITRVVLLFVGAASVFSTPLWNHGKHVLGRLDAMSISTAVYAPVVLFAVIVYAALPKSLSVNVQWYGYGLDLIVLGFIVTVASVGNLFLSQIFARVSMSREALGLSAAELSCMVLILYYYSSVQNYLFLWAILVMVKYLMGSYLLRRVYE